MLSVILQAAAAWMIICVLRIIVDGYHLVIAHRYVNSMVQAFTDDELMQFIRFYKNEFYDPFDLMLPWRTLAGRRHRDAIDLIMYNK